MDVVWKESLERIRKRVSPQAYHTWFGAVRLQGVENLVCILAVPHTFFIEMMSKPYSSLILEVVGAVMERPLERVEFVVSDALAETVAPIDQESQERTSTRSVAAGEAPKLGASAPGVGLQSYLSPKYSFENFVVGGSNQFAHAAARAVADNPAKAYNPLFIYGDVGLGKTHLLHAIGLRTREHFPGARISYVSSEQFTNEVINSIRYDRMADFRARYRNCDVLIIDDIQFIAGKDRTQEEFFHTFNTLHEARRQIVLSADRFPKQMPDIEERLRSRFEWGLIADIQHPDLETKIAILQKKAEVEKISLPPDVAMLLATSIKSNVRELEGALIRLGAYASLTGQDITVDLARRNLRDIIRETRPVLSIDEIQSKVAKFFHVKVPDLKAKRRTKELVLPRQVAMYLCRSLTDLSFPDIGRGFGGRDHTTVMHACRQVERMMDSDPSFKINVERVVQGLTNEV